MRCLLCRSWGLAGLCGPCRRAHQPDPSRPRCPGCGLRLALGVPRCADCQRHPPGHGGAWVAVDYAHPWDRVLRQLKFGERPESATALATLMSEGLLEQGLRAPGSDPAGGAVTRIVPVPLSPERLARRGYNQAWELARPLARRLALPTRPDVLLRSVDLPGQAEQDRQARLKRLEGVFRVSAAGRGWLAGQSVALVDDVLTTGATAAEATRTLLAAGAREVVTWAFARTPPPEEGPS